MDLFSLWHAFVLDAEELEKQLGVPQPLPKEKK